MFPLKRLFFDVKMVLEWEIFMNMEECGIMTNEKAWDYAIGVVQIDGIKPSDDFLKLVEKEKRGEITGDDIRRVLYNKYKVKEGGNDD